MNNVHVASVRGATSLVNAATPSIETLDLRLSENQGAWLWAMEVQQEDHFAAAIQNNVACLAKGRMRNWDWAMDDDGVFLESSHWVCKLGINGGPVNAAFAVMASVQKEFLAPYRYVMVANPSVCFWARASAGSETLIVRVFYKVISLSEDQVNAVIAWQGDWGRRT